MASRCKERAASRRLVEVLERYGDFLTAFKTWGGGILHFSDLERICNSMQSAGEADGQNAAAPITHVREPANMKLAVHA